MVETDGCKLLSIQKEDYGDIKKLYMDQNVRQFLGGVSIKQGLVA